MKFKPTGAVLLALAITGVGLTPFSISTARAESAAAFLESIEGSYAGRGKARVIGSDLETIACKINSKFNGNKLAVSGNCASTKGKGTVNGGITAKGTSLSGTFVSPRPNVQVTKSSGEIRGGKMHLSAFMIDNQSGKSYRVRQVISKTGKGLKAEFFLYDNVSKTYKPSGNINLTKK